MLSYDISKKYRVTGRIAVGERTIIYRARRLRDGKAVALKILRNELATDSEAVRAIFREAQAMRLIGEACAPVLHEVGWHGALPFLAMELLVGEDLGSHMGRGRPLSLAKLITVALAIAESVAAAHRAGILHRDLKPANILLSSAHDGKFFAKIIDFETAVGKRLELKPMRGQVGTTLYAAPELSSPRARVDARADVYSFGCILFQMAYRNRSFERVNQRLPILRGGEPVIGSARTAWGALARLCRRAMSHDRRFRPRTIQEVIDELRGIESLNKRRRRPHV
jgi:serine/threonine-protein kinase